MIKQKYKNVKTCKLCGSQESFFKYEDESFYVYECCKCNNFFYSYNRLEFLKEEVIKEKTKVNQEYESKSLNEELWREYDFGGRVYRIENPVILFIRRGGTTHRVVDSKNIVHCVPAPGTNGCVLRCLLRLAPLDNNNPVQF